MNIKRKLTKAQQIRMDKMHLALRGKTYEQIFGVERAMAEKKKRSKPLKGNAPWNKGLTKETSESVNKISKTLGNKLGWVSFEQYGLEFNKLKKEQIRQRDGYRCQECFRHQDELRTKKSNKPYKLPIHHIDYDKKNNADDNLISLCRPCHMQTNFKRKDWETYYKSKVGG